MTDAVKEQLSACLDGELPSGELDLLLKRLERDPQLRGSIGRYAMLGEVLRAQRPVTASSTFADKVSAAIAAEPSAQPAAVPAPRRAYPKWLQPVAGLAVAAGVAAVAVIALQPTTLPNEQVAATTPAAVSAPQAGSGQAASYTVPTNTSSDAYIPAARLTNYVVAHSEYSSPLGRRTVLSGVLSDDDDAMPVQVTDEPLDQEPVAPEAADDTAARPAERR